MNVVFYMIMTPYISSIKAYVLVGGIIRKLTSQLCACSR